MQSMPLSTSASVMSTAPVRHKNSVSRDLGPAAFEARLREQDEEKSTKKKEKSADPGAHQTSRKLSDENLINVEDSIQQELRGNCGKGCAMDGTTSATSTNMSFHLTAVASELRPSSHANSAQVTTPSGQAAGTAMTAGTDAGQVFSGNANGKGSTAATVEQTIAAKDAAPIKPPAHSIAMNKTGTPGIKSTPAQANTSTTPSDAAVQVSAKNAEATAEANPRLASAVSAGAARQVQPETPREKNDSSTRKALRAQALTVASSSSRATAALGAASPSITTTQAQADTYALSVVSDSLLNAGKSSLADTSRREDTSQSAQQILQSLNAKESATTFKADSVKIFFNRIEHALQSMQQERVGSLQLQISLDNGQSLRIQLNLRGRQLSTRIHTDSEALRGLLRDGWEGLTRSLASKGVEASELQFDTDTADAQQDRSSQDGRSGDELHQALASGMSASTIHADAATSSNTTQAIAVTHTDKGFSRIA